MKKNIKVALICFLLFAHFIGSLVLAMIGYELYRESKYSDWQTVSVDNIVSFRIPNQWVMSIKDDVIFIKSIDENELIFVGAIWRREKDSYEAALSFLGEEVERVERISAKMNSFGAYYYNDEYCIDGVLSIKQSVSMGNDVDNYYNSVLLIALKEMPEKTMILIADSFREV